MKVKIKEYILHFQIVYLNMQNIFHLYIMSIEGITAYHIFL